MQNSHQYLKVFVLLIDPLFFDIESTCSSDPTLIANLRGLVDFLEMYMLCH